MLDMDLRPDARSFASALADLPGLIKLLNAFSKDKQLYKKQQEGTDIKHKGMVDWIASRPIHTHRKASTHLPFDKRQQSLT